MKGILIVVQIASGTNISSWKVTTIKFTREEEWREGKKGVRSGEGRQEVMIRTENLEHGRFNTTGAYQQPSTICEDWHETELRLYSHDNVDVSVSLVYS